MSALRIDAHHHIWDLAVRPQPWTDGLPAMRRTFTFEELVPTLDRHRFDGTVLVQTVNDPDETSELLELAATQPWIAGVVGWVDLARPEVASRIQQLRSAPGGDRLVAVRHQVQYETGDWLARPAVRRGIAALGEAGLAYELVVTAAQLPSVASLVAALPEVRFVLDHGGKPPIASGALQPWAAHVAAIAARPNVICKLSGLATEAGDGWTEQTLRPYVDVLAESFGASRLMFGSDWPVCLLAGGYDRVLEATEHLSAQWSESDRADLFGRTAVHAYGLTIAASR